MPTRDGPWVHGFGGSASGRGPRAAGGRGNIRLRFPALLAAGLIAVNTVPDGLWINVLFDHKMRFMVRSTCNKPYIFKRTKNTNDFFHGPLAREAGRHRRPRELPARALSVSCHTSTDGCGHTTASSGSIRRSAPASGVAQVSSRGPRRRNASQAFADPLPSVLQIAWLSLQLFEMRS